MTKVYIDGSAGTTGLRIYERFAGRADTELLTIAPELRKDAAERARMINSSDITFLCLPDDAAREAVAMVTNPEVRIIDTSTAHRTNPEWCYGFAELSPAHRAALTAGKRVAVPGCHASGFIAIVYPLVKAGLMPKDYPAVCYSVTGYSGGGKKMIEQYQSADRDSELDAPRQYALKQKHKHLPEMQAVTGLDYAPIFSPIVADYYSGMTVTVPLHTRLLCGSATPDSVRELLAKHYKGQPLVRVLDSEPETGFIGSNNLSGKDYMEITVSGNEDRILIASRFDNLGKGASGAAIQCMNIMLGLDETTGLQAD